MRKSLHHYKSIQNGTLYSVSSPVLLSADQTQPPRHSQSFLPAHQDRQSPRRLLHSVQEGIGRVRCGLVKKYDEDLNTNSYVTLRNSGGSMIELCGDRQRKCDGLEKWSLHFFIESLPVMLQASLLLLTCGLCRYMWSINTSVAYTLIGLTGLGVIFFVAIVIAGMLSYACPFQTPASTALHGPDIKAEGLADPPSTITTNITRS